MLLVASIGFSGCGRRGALEEPGQIEASQEAVQPEFAPGGGNLSDAQSPGAQEPDQDRPAAAPNRRFFLDPLI